MSRGMESVSEALRPAHLGQDDQAALGEPGEMHGPDAGDLLGDLLVAGVECDGAAAPLDDIEQGIAIHRGDQLPAGVNGGDERLVGFVVAGVEAVFLGEVLKLIAGDFG